MNQFSHFIVWLLLGATIVAFLLGDHIDAISIAVILVLNAVIGFVQEARAEKSLRALKKLASPISKVIRDGKFQILPSEELVLGDLLMLEAGDHIPADGRIVQSSQLNVQESALTGESMSILKKTERLPFAEVALGDRSNMAFMGTYVVGGRGYLLVTAVGERTELGKIASLIQAGEKEMTPLQVSLEKLGRRLVFICLIIVAVVFALGILRGAPLFEMALLSLSLAVAAIPEGLPAAITIALSIGVRRMVKRNALIRRLSSVETLGCASVICTDKTGTLTENEMHVRHLWTLNADALALKIGVLCNHARLVQKEGEWRLERGDPTEGALLIAALKENLKREELEEQFPQIEEIPFDSERKRMCILRQTPDGPMLYAKGAPELLLNLCSSVQIGDEVKPLTEEKRKEILQKNGELAKKTYRVLAVAYRPVEEKLEEKELIFVGLFALSDPPRPEAKAAIEECERAGIRTVMITGDHRETAIAIAQELGLMKEGRIAIDGVELSQMSDETLEKKIAQIAVFARVEPEHKLRIVNAWKKKGEVVAMTGDGVNDAPAIHEADIGIAMGQTGTEVTKEASDMVILDDNFTSIVHAIEEGRTIYRNILKFINYLLSANVAEIFVLFIAMLVGFQDKAGGPLVAMLPVQILWMNLVTDGFPAIALALDPLNPKVMKRPPRKRSAPLLPWQTVLRLFSISLIIALGTLAACWIGLLQSTAKAQTMTFTTLIILELVKMHLVRVQDGMKFFSNFWVVVAIVLTVLLQLGAIYVPSMQFIFRTVPLSARDWTAIGLITIVVWILSRILSSEEKEVQIQKG